jgi:hypothetical protein
MDVKQVKINWNPDLSIFASESFLRAVGDEYGWLGGYDDSGRLCCVLPYTVIRKAIFRMVRFRVETIAIGNELEIEEEKTFLDKVVEFFRVKGADMIIPATTNTIFRTYPDGAIVAPYGSYLIDLTQPEETILNNFSASHRRKVRLARKKGLEIKEGTQFLRTAYDLVKDTFKRWSRGFMGWEEFKRYVGSLDENVKILVADYQGREQGAVVIPFSKHSAYYVYGGSIPQPITGATNLLHWEAIRQFRELGVRRYDFVGVRIKPEKGSKQDGLKMFKERFGGQLVRGYMWKYSIHPAKFAAYSMVVHILRGGDIVDQERHKLKLA